MNNDSQLKNRLIVHEATLVSKAVKQNKFKRVLYLIGGSLALGLAILGIFVPGLPVTPLTLLSAALYAKSSPKLYNWLLNNKILGPKIKNYQQKRGVTRKGKLSILAFMTMMVLFSSFIVIRENMVVRYIILSLGFIGSIVVWFFVPNAKDENSEIL